MALVVPASVVCYCAPIIHRQSPMTCSLARRLPLTRVMALVELRDLVSATSVVKAEDVMDALTLRLSATQAAQALDDAQALELIWFDSFGGESWIGRSFLPPQRVDAWRTVALCLLADDERPPRCVLRLLAHTLGLPADLALVQTDGRYAFLVGGRELVIGDADALALLIRDQFGDRWRQALRNVLEAVQR
jgi:hypothetical protein